MNDKYAKEVVKELKLTRKATEAKVKELRLIRECMQDDTLEINYKPEVSG